MSLKYGRCLLVWDLLFFFPHRRALVCGCGKSVISLQFDPTEIQSQQPPASRSDGYHPPSLIICLPAHSDHHEPRFLGNVTVGKFALQGCNTKPTLAMHVSKGSRSPSLGAAVGRGATAACGAGCLGQLEVTPGFMLAGVQSCVCRLSALLVCLQKTGICHKKHPQP